MKWQLSSTLALGDINDVEAYVHVIVATLGIGSLEEQEELVADGLEIVSRIYGELDPGASLQEKLGGMLAFRLRDRWRARHPEWRRDARGATSYMLPPATQISESYDGGPDGFDVSALIMSRMALQIFQHEADLRDPRQIGRYYGVPSWRAVPTGAAREIWARIQEERDPIGATAPQPPPFGVHLDPIV